MTWANYMGWSEHTAAFLAYEGSDHSKSWNHPMGVGVYDNGVIRVETRMPSVNKTHDFPIERPITQLPKRKSFTDWLFGK